MISLLFLLIFLLAILDPISPQVTPLPWQVTNAMSTREMRYHHVVWHNVRNLWNQLDRETRDQITSYGWAPPRPAKDRNGNSLKDNNSGEDFLYFHRKMIENVQNLMNQTTNTTITLWNVIPSRDNATYPMQRRYTAPTNQLTKLVTYYKSDTYYRYLKNQERRLTNATFLRSMTLGQLGSYIEFASDVHQGLHFRFSEYNRMMRPRTSAVLPYINPRWDVNTSDWLCDIYCSQVNPWFWKIHGWIDNRINDWQRAHNLTNITWNGTWLGGNMTDLPERLNIPTGNSTRLLAKDDMAGMAGMDMGPSSNAMNITVLEEIVKLLVKSGHSCDYFNELDMKAIPVGWENVAKCEEEKERKNNKK